MIGGARDHERSLSTLEPSRRDPRIEPVGIVGRRKLESTPERLNRVIGKLCRATHDEPQVRVHDLESLPQARHIHPITRNEKRLALSRRRSWNGARCLVTGASSGLGKALAEQLVRAGARVVLTGRSEERLQIAAQGLIDEGADPDRIITFPADLTIDEDRQRLFAQVARHFDALDLVVNNAGVGAAGQFETHEPGVLRDVFEINFFALAEVCRASLPFLTLGNQPALVNMGSIVARRGLADRSEYSASKFAVAGLTEALRLEWHRLGIHILLVNPGYTKTPFDQHAIVNTSHFSVAHLRIMSADAVALATLRALQKKKREITLTWQGKLLLLVNAIEPRIVDIVFSRWLLKYYPESRVREQACLNCQVSAEDASLEAPPQYVASR